MTRVKCPECGADEWVTKHGYDDMVAANRRFRRSNDAQALKIARLDLEVMELSDRDKGRDRKVRNQSRVINRLEGRLRELGQRPYEHESFALIPNDLKIVGEFVNEHDSDDTVMQALVNIQHAIGHLLGAKE